jgi:hypothetical protein
MTDTRKRHPEIAEGAIRRPTLTPGPQRTMAVRERGLPAEVRVVDLHFPDARGSLRLARPVQHVVEVHGVEGEEPVVDGVEVCGGAEPSYDLAPFR